MLSAVCIPATRIQCCTPETNIKFPVVIERGSHPFPFRTRQLSLSSPMILRGQLCGKVGRRRDKIYEGPRGNSRAFSFSPAAFVYSTVLDVFSSSTRRRCRTNGNRARLSLSDLHSHRRDRGPDRQV